MTEIEKLKKEIEDLKLIIESKNNQVESKNKHIKRLEKLSQIKKNNPNECLIRTVLYCTKIQYSTVHRRQCPELTQSKFHQCLFPDYRLPFAFERD